MYHDCLAIESYCPIECSTWTTKVVGDNYLLVTKKADTDGHGVGLA